MDIMLQGQINCECGNNFYFMSIREEVPCMRCGKMHKNEGEPVPPKQEDKEVSEEGTIEFLPETP